MTCAACGGWLLVLLSLLLLLQSCSIPLQTSKKDPDCSPSGKNV